MPFVLTNEPSTFMSDDKPLANGLITRSMAKNIQERLNSSMKGITISTTHYQKNVNYRRSESINNSHNPSVMMFYRRTSDGKISIGKMLVGNHLPTDC